MHFINAVHTEAVCVLSCVYVRDCESALKFRGIFPIDNTLSTQTVLITFTGLTMYEIIYLL